MGEGLRGQAGRSVPLRISLCWMCMAFRLLARHGMSCLLLSATAVTAQLPNRHHEKLMGQVLVPAAHRVSCEFEALPADAAQLRHLLEPAQT